MGRDDPAAWPARDSRIYVPVRYEDSCKSLTSAPLRLRHGDAVPSQPRAQQRQAANSGRHQTPRPNRLM